MYLCSANALYGMLGTQHLVLLKLPLCGGLYNLDCIVITAESLR